jgi:hypothetical protein
MKVGILLRACYQLCPMGVMKLTVEVWGHLTTALYSLWVIEGRNFTFWRSGSGLDSCKSVYMRITRDEVRSEARKRIDILILPYPV